MKKSFLMIGALCMGAAFVSCVDDSESSEVKDLRKLQLSQEQAKLDQTYWNMYEAAINNVKTYQGDLNTAQQDLDGIKSGNLNHTAAKEAAIAYQNMVIARNQKDINDKKAEIAAQKAMEGMTYEQVQEAKIAAKNAEEKAKKDAADFWLELNDAGLNLAYQGNNPQTVDVSAGYAAKIGMLLGGGSVTNIKYQNEKLCENEWVKAMNLLYSSDIYSYEDADGLTKTSDTYSFYYGGDGDKLPAGTYTATSMISSETKQLQDNSGFAYQTYTLYTFKDVKKYSTALTKFVKELKDAVPAADDPYYASAYNNYKQYVALQEKVTELVAVLDNASKYGAYTALIADYVTKANKIYALETAKTSAAALSTAYASYSGGVASDNEKTIAGLEDAIKGYNKAIAGATEEINKIENEIVDDATAQKYYEALVADLNSQIAANNAIAEKYRALILGSTSSNTQNTTPAETTAE